MEVYHKNALKHQQFPLEDLVVNQENWGQNSYSIESGSIKGVARIASRKLDNKKQDLNDLAFTFATAVIRYMWCGEGIPLFWFEWAQMAIYCFKH